MLPKNKHPTSMMLIPSLSTERLFRPFTTQEEKILLLANESEGEDREILILQSALQIINNCYSDSEPIPLDDLTLFDVSYLFLKLRSLSVSNMLEMKYKDIEDEKVREFSVDLNDLEIKINDNHKNIIEVGNGIKVKLKYPSVKSTISVADGSVQSVDDFLNKAILSSIDKIYDDQTVYEDYTEEELLEFFNSLPAGGYKGVKDFFDTMPKVEINLDYVNDKGNKIEINLSELTDFFIWALPT